LPSRLRKSHGPATSPVCLGPTIPNSSSARKCTSRSINRWSDRRSSPRVMCPWMCPITVACARAMRHAGTPGPTGSPWPTHARCSSKTVGRPDLAEVHDSCSENGCA
jgi:hypothetical protein